MLSNERPAKAYPYVAKAVKADRMNHAGLWIAGTGKAKGNAVGCAIELRKTAAPQNVYKGAETIDRDFIMNSQENPPIFSGWDELAQNKKVKH